MTSPSTLQPSADSSFPLFPHQPPPPSLSHFDHLPNTHPAHTAIAPPFQPHPGNVPSYTMHGNSTPFLPTQQHARQYTHPPSSSMNHHLYPSMPSPPPADYMSSHNRVASLPPFPIQALPSHVGHICRTSSGETLPLDYSGPSSAHIGMYPRDDVNMHDHHRELHQQYPPDQEAYAFRSIASQVPFEPRADHPANRHYSGSAASSGEIRGLPPLFFHPHASHVLPMQPKQPFYLGTAFDQPSSVQPHMYLLPNQILPTYIPSHQEQSHTFTGSAHPHEAVRPASFCGSQVARIEESSVPIVSKQATSPLPPPSDTASPSLYREDAALPQNHCEVPSQPQAMPNASASHQQKTPKQKKEHHTTQRSTSSPCRSNPNDVRHGESNEQIRVKLPTSPCKARQMSNSSLSSGHTRSQDSVAGKVPLPFQGRSSKSSERKARLSDDALLNAPSAVYETNLQYDVHETGHAPVFYQPCVNPTCQNIFHYTQHIYQPVDTRLCPSSRTLDSSSLMLMEVPGLLQPPAWCELRPCGCTLCRDCLTHLISKCRTLDNLQQIRIDEDEGYREYEKVKKFDCIVCDATVGEFGPVNEALQYAFETENAILPSSVDVELSEQDSTDFQGTFIDPNVDGFQSAQDLVPSLHSMIDPISSGLLGPVDAAPLHLSGTPYRMAYSALSPHLTSELPPIPPIGQLRQQDYQPSRECPSDTSTLYRNDNLTVQDRLPSLSPLGHVNEATPTFTTLHNNEDITMSSRQISANSTVFTSHTHASSLDSPVVPETPPELAPWSSSISSSATNSPEVLQRSPYLAMRSAVFAQSDQKTPSPSVKGELVPCVCPEGDMAAQVVTVLEMTIEERQARVERDFKQLSKHTYGQTLPRTTEERAPSTGLGLVFGTFLSRGGNDAETSTVATFQPTLTNSAVQDKPVHSATPIADQKLLARDMLDIRDTNEMQECQPSAESIPPKRHQISSCNDVSRASPATPARKYQSSSSNMQGTSPRSLRGRGRGKTNGQIGSGRTPPHSVHLPAVFHNKEPSASDLTSFRSRTNTESSIRTSVSSSSFSSNGRFPNSLQHHRKVSEAENKLPELPELLVHPSREMIHAWNENKVRWWRDPWNGKLMGIRQKVVNGEMVMCRSDGSPLTSGRAAGVSWPILKVHNIAFSTTIADVEQFVPPGVLAPLEYNAQAIHIVCDSIDGKTRPYAYVECISDQAAELLVSASDGKYLAGRQVVFRPATQKDLALDLFVHLRKGGYARDTILGDFRARSDSTSREEAVESFGSVKDLDLFTQDDYEHLVNLLDMTLPFASPKKTASRAKRGSEGLQNANYFALPPERPFTRIASMITKFPCHAMQKYNAGLPEKQKQALGRLFECLFCRRTASSDNKL